MWGADNALSVSEIKAEMNSMRKTCMGDCKRFKKVIFKLDDLADDQNMLSDESRTTLVRLCALKEGPDDAVRVCGDQSGETLAQQSVCVRGG